MEGLIALCNYKVPFNDKVKTVYEMLRNDNSSIPGSVNKSRANKFCDFTGLREADNEKGFVFIDETLTIEEQDAIIGVTQ